VETATATIVSSQTLQAPVDDVFRLQDELAQRIVESLSPSLAGREGERRRGAPASARAYEFYLRGNEVFRSWSQAGLARDLYRQCVEADPEFAPAWARLGRAHRLLAKYHLEQPDENRARAEDCFRRALELDPQLPLSHKLASHHQAELGRAQDAMLGLLGIARRSPNDPEVFAGLVHACRYNGLLDASEAAHREARRLDPHISTSVVYTWWARGDMQRLADPADSGDAADFELRALALSALGRDAEAVQLLSVDHGGFAPMFVSVLRSVRALIERQPGGFDLIAEVVDMHIDPEAHFVYGCVQAHFGDLERAASTLRRAVEAGYASPLALEHAWLEPLRGRAELEPARALARKRHADAAAAFHAAGGEELLGIRVHPVG
jgi:tetratricopeptide (TPR) repeat protein